VTSGVGVTLVALQGDEDRPCAPLIELSKATRQQPGCLQYRVHRLADSRTFFVYELYVDRQRWEADVASEHFHRLAETVAMISVENADRMAWQPIEEEASAPGR
jgi:quinol monooxygenase YgiN